MMVLVGKSDFVIVITVCIKHMAKIQQNSQIDKDKFVELQKLRCKET